MAHTDILVIVRQKHASRFQEHLSLYREFHTTFVESTEAAMALLAERQQHLDLLVLDNGLPNAYEFITTLRQTYPRLLIVSVDEEADFALPGQADDISIKPFENDDLARRINRLMADRHMETLRADSMPPVREVVKTLRKATGETGKQQAAVTACRELGYDYVAFYQLDSLDPLKITLKAQDGPAPIQAVAPRQAAADDIMSWVATTGQSRIAGPTDELNYPLVRRGRLGAVACTPVGSANRYGVIVACRNQPSSITQQQVMLLELISAQLAAVISKEA